MGKIPELDFSLWLNSETKEEFVRQLGNALSEIGFFSLANHGISQDLIDQTYDLGAEFFSLDVESKSKYKLPEIAHQRGWTPFGTEHAKDSNIPDLKEFWQTGRQIKPDSTYPKNVWPDHEVPQFKSTFEELYESMESLSVELLQAASIYLGMESNWLSEMSEDGNTIMRLIHYPPTKGAKPGAVRSAQHEDINFITLLVGSTASGLQVLDNENQWHDVEAGSDKIIVDSGDMIQNLTNGIFKSTTHRVVNPDDSTSSRYSMPMFVHPRNDVDLTPHQKFVEMTSGKAEYESITAGDFLHQRLVEIGLVEE